MAARSAQYRQAILTLASGDSELISEIYDNLEVSDRSFQGNTTVLTVSGPSEVVDRYVGKAGAGRR